MPINRILLRVPRSRAFTFISSQSSSISRHLSSSSKIFQQQQPQQRYAQSQPQPNIHRAYYRTHGRALFKSLTLAFLSYQVFYWIWLTLETEAMKDEKSEIIHSLQSEVKLLSSGKGTHVLEGEKRLLDEESKR